MSFDFENFFKRQLFTITRMVKEFEHVPAEFLLTPCQRPP